MKRPTTRISRSIKQTRDSINSSNSTKKHRESHSSQEDLFFKSLPYLHLTHPNKEHFITTSKILEEKIIQISEINSLFFLKISQIFQIFFDSDFQNRIQYNPDIDNFDEALLNQMYSIKKNVTNLLEKEVKNLKTFFETFLNYERSEEFKKKRDFEKLFGDRDFDFLYKKHDKKETEKLKELINKENNFNYGDDEKFPEIKENDLKMEKFNKKNDNKAIEDKTNNQNLKEEELDIVYSSNKIRREELSPTLFNSKGVGIFHTKYSNNNQEQDSSNKKGILEEIKEKPRDTEKKEEPSPNEITPQRGSYAYSRNSKINSNNSKKTSVSLEKNKDLDFSKKTKSPILNKFKESPKIQNKNNNNNDYDYRNFGVIPIKDQNNVISFRNENMMNNIIKNENNNPNNYDRQKNRLRLWNEDESYLEKRLMGIRIEKEKAREKHYKSKNYPLSNEKPSYEDNSLNNNKNTKYKQNQNYSVMMEKNEKFEEFESKIEAADSSLTDLQEDKSDQKEGNLNIDASISDEKTPEKYYEAKKRDPSILNNNALLPSLKSSVISASTVSAYKEKFLNSNEEQSLPLYGRGKNHHSQILPRSRVSRDISLISRENFGKDGHSKSQFIEKNGGEPSPRGARFKIEKRLVCDPESEGKIKENKKIF